MRARAAQRAQVGGVVGEDEDALSRRREGEGLARQAGRLGVRRLQLHGGDVVAGDAQRVAQARHAERVQLLRGARGDGARRGRGAIERGVVDDHRLAVGAEPHVELDAVGAAVERRLEAGQRVLGMVGRISAMPEQQWAHTGTRVRKYRSCAGTMPISTVMIST